MPVIGFGTSSIMGGGRASAGRLLEAAYDAGIRHFDTAAYYGMGEAESALGAFLATRRSEVTITTKTGIEPPSTRSAYRVAVAAGRKFVRALPITKPLFQSATRQMIRVGAFSPTDVVRSLDRSLMALRTDYIDFFLLHDYSLQGASEELVDTLVRTVTAGKIRSFGIGAPFKDVVQVVNEEPRLARVIQFENSALRRNLDDLPNTDNHRLVITHGALSDSFRLIVSSLQQDPAKSRRWFETLGRDVRNGDVLAAMMLDYAVRANCLGLVLFSSRSAQRIASNARAVFNETIDDQTAAMFADLVAKEIVGS